jgi:hypothetical protein
MTIEEAGERFAVALKPPAYCRGLARQAAAVDCVIREAGGVITRVEARDATRLLGAGATLD